MPGTIRNRTLTEPSQPSAAPPTVSHMLGEMTWLLTQSPLHRVLAIGDLEWLVMPALLSEQFYVFRDGSKPVGLALWAKCTPEGVKKLERGMIEPENRLTLDEWTKGDRIWLVDLIAPALKVHSCDASFAKFAFGVFLPLACFALQVFE